MQEIQDRVQCYPLQESKGMVKCRELRRGKILAVQRIQYTESGACRKIRTGLVQGFQTGFNIKNLRQGPMQTGGQGPVLRIQDRVQWNLGQGLIPLQEVSAGQGKIQNRVEFQDNV